MGHRPPHSVRSRPDALSGRSTGVLKSMKTLKKLVASTTLKDVTWNASVITGDVAATLRTLKQQSGGTIMKYGVSQLDRTLLTNKLVDEYNLWIVPTVVRQGKRAFEDVLA